MNNDFPFNHFINLKENNDLCSPEDNIAENLSHMSLENNEEKQQLKEELFSSNELGTINEEILASLKNNVNPEKYRAFFGNSFQISSIKSESVDVLVPTEFIKKMIENHYLSLVKENLFMVLGAEYSVNILTLPNNKNKGLAKKSTKTSFKIDTQRPLTSDDAKRVIETNEIKTNSSKLRIDKSKSFENFIIGHSNNMAHAFSQAVAKDPGHIYPQLYIHGNSGLGKTHLLHAVCNHIGSHKPHLKICFTTANDFMTEMVVAIQAQTIDQFRHKYTEKVDLLIIDDIHELSNKVRTQTEFFYIFNELQNKGKQLIFTSDKPPKEISGIEDRIRTRLSSALLIDIQQPDLETRIAILKEKAKEKDIFLDDEVINLVASCVKSNVRELEGNLVKLGAYSDLMNIDIDIEIAKEQLNLSDCLDEKILTIDSISKAVSSYYKITLGDIKGKSRKKEVALARHISMYMCHKILKKTLEEIGEFFNNRDHSTVIHGIKKVQNLIKTDNKISHQIFEIETRL